jgi:hypothetical protein
MFILASTADCATAEDFAAVDLEREAAARLILVDQKLDLAQADAAHDGLRRRLDAHGIDRLLAMPRRPP